MTIGQWDNVLWMDARQWRITASNFDRIANRQAENYSPSLLKLLLGEYGCLTSHAIKWGIDYEDTTIRCFQSTKHLEVHPCGVFISHLQPFLATSPDGLIKFLDGSLGLVEVMSIQASCISDYRCTQRSFVLPKL